MATTIATTAEPKGRCITRALESKGWGYVSGAGAVPDHGLHGRLPKYAAGQLVRHHLDDLWDRSASMEKQIRSDPLSTKVAERVVGGL